MDPNTDELSTQQQAEQTRRELNAIREQQLARTFHYRWAFERGKKARANNTEDPTDTSAMSHSLTKT